MSRADWLRLIVLSLLWGGSFFFVEIAIVELPALIVVWARVTIGAVFLGLIMWAMGHRLPFGWATWRVLAVMGLLNNAIPFTLFGFAQGQISGALAAILNATTPMFTLIAVHFLTDDEGITPVRALGLVAGFIGVAVMMLGRGMDGTLWAKAACLGAAMSYGVAGVWGRQFRAMSLAPLQVAFGQCASATVLILPVMLAASPPWHVALPSAQVWAALAGLGLLSTVLAYMLFFRILASAGAVRLALVTFLIPVSATLLGVAFLGQTPDVRHLAGFALIAVGLVAVGRKTAPRAASSGN